MEENSPKSKFRYRRSVFWPILLIVLGIVLLLNNSGSLKGDAWETLIQLWPLLFIVGGLDSLLRREGIAGPIFGIGLGLVFLLSNFNMLAINPWVMLLQIWPLFLVAIGLDIAFGRRSIWGALVAAGLIIALLAGALWYFGADIAKGRIASDEIVQPFDGATQAKLEIKPVVGSLVVSVLDDSKNLVEGSVNRFKGENVRQEFDVKDGLGTFKLYTSDSGIIYPSGPQTDATWKLGISPQAPVDMDANLIVGEMTLDLSDLRVEALNAQIVIGRTIVILPEKGRFSASIEGVIGAINIVVPEGMEVSINSDLGLANLQTPTGYFKSGDQTVSPGYANAENKVDLQVSQVIGLVSISKK